MKLLLILFSLLCLSAQFATSAELSLKITASQPELQTILQTALSLPEEISSDPHRYHHWLTRYRTRLPQQVAEILQPYGHFDTQTRTQLQQTDTGRQILKVEVNAGKPIRITRFDLQITGPGTDLPEFHDLILKFPLKVGDVLRQDHYEEGKALLLRDIAELGFLDADYRTHQIRVYRREYRADITLYLETGDRYLFGSTSFTGTSSLSQQFLARYLSHSDGQFFSYEKLGRSQINLQNSDLFQSVNAAAQLDRAADKRVPIEIALQPRPRHQWRPGLGYGTDTGARTSLRYRNLNLLGDGHVLKGDLLLAERQQSLTSSYIIPDSERLDSQTQFRIGYERTKTDSYLSRELYSEAEYQRALSRRLFAAVFLRLTHESSEVGGEKKRSQLLLPGARLQWNRPNNQSSRLTGVYAGVELKAAHDALLSDTSLLQLDAETTRIFSLTDSLFALVRLKGGATLHNDPLVELPASLRFFAGGDRSVRGYKYQSLGPRDSNGQVVGGDHLLVGNFELEQRLTDNWGGAVFYDIGNAFDSFPPEELVQGAGVGVRRYTPIGPIRLDLAWQLDQPDPDWRLHLSIGLNW